MALIEMNNGMAADVDDEDFLLVHGYHWTALRHRHTWYAVTRIDGRTIRMHRLILGLTDSRVQGEHEDGNGLNNRRSNLRPATNSQNQANVHVVRSNSGFKGVSRGHDQFRSKPYLAKVGRVHVGWFPTAIEAAHACNRKALELHGSYANLNPI